MIYWDQVTRARAKTYDCTGTITCQYPHQRSSKDVIVSNSNINYTLS